MSRQVLWRSFLLLCALSSQVCAGGQAEGRFFDDFEDVGNVRVMHQLARRRDFPRIVIRPDVRINRTDPREYMYDGKPAGCAWFPWIVRLDNGELLCFFKEALGHQPGPGDRAVVCRSRDGGRTWAPAEVIREDHDLAIEPMSPTQTSDGSVWVKLRVTRLAGERKGWDNSAVLRSTDNGHTWEDVLDQGLQAGPEMSNGEVLWLSGAAIEPWLKVRATITSRVVDGEIKWSEKRLHPELGPTSDEWDVTETGNPGELVAMMRQQQHSHYFAVGKSYDYGKTWTRWRDSNVYIGPVACRPRVHTMPDGRLICTYGQRWIGRAFAVVSKDNGGTWDVAHRQTILHSPTEYYRSWDCHYTDIARAEGDMWIGIDYVAYPRTGREWSSQLRGIYGTFIDARYFEDVFKGVTLKESGTPRVRETKGLWRFDELTGDFARDSVNANYGEVHGAKRVRGRFGQALSFNGKNDHVMVYDDATLWTPPGSFTIEAWINTRDAMKDQTIVSKAPAYALVLREGRPVLELGPWKNMATARMGSPLENDRWYHIVLVYGQRANYRRATFFIDGREVSFSKPADPTGRRPRTFHEAMSFGDAKIASGEMFREYYDKNQSGDNLVIGMDNDLAGRSFDGMIDEVVIHGVDLVPEQVRTSFSRGYPGEGAITSRAIRRPAGAKWTMFEAETTEPAGTKVRFWIEDAEGRLLKANVESGADLGAVDAEAIVLRAELGSSDPGQTPILHAWSVGTSVGEAGIVTEPFPEQSAAMVSRHERSLELSPQPGQVTVKPAAGVPLSLYRVPVGRSETIRFELTVNPQDVRTAKLALIAKDFDDPAELTVTFNGSTPLTIPKELLSDSDARKGFIEIPTELLRRGENEVVFTFASDLDGSTEGFEVEEALLVLVLRGREVPL